MEGVATIWFNGSDEQGELQLRRHDVLTGSTTTFVEGAFTPTRSPWSVSAGAGRVLIEYGGTDGSWELVDATGTALDLATPTDGRFGENYARTGVDVYGFSPVLSTDGTTIYWIEDPAGPSGSGPLTIRSLDVESGEAGPAIEIPFEDGINAPVPALSVHGDHMLVSFPGFMPIEPVAPILVELTGAATTVETNLPSGRWEFATARQAPAPPANTKPNTEHQQHNQDHNQPDP